MSRVGLGCFPQVAFLADIVFFFSSRRRHTRLVSDWSSDVCSSDLRARCGRDDARRHTSFASVWVYPVVDDKIEVEINDKDLRIDTYRSSGAGGQHVNKTDSAVRITHMPSGIVVQCQSERSQHQNRAHAFAMLRARLYEAELQKREAVTDAMNATKTDIGWGHQIRSYVLQPYQMVKDLRTGVETGNPAAVLDGDLDRFLAGALAQRIEGADAVAGGG